MIIDSSALIAILFDERGWQELRRAIDTATTASIPAPALTETQLVVAGRGRDHSEGLKELLATLFSKGVGVASFEQKHADLTSIAREHYGKGNGKGGLLNFGDLMVYAVAKDRGEPLLFTGHDFATTDLLIHPASRIDE